MAITNLKVSNFKSFKDLDLNLGRFNVVIGANAAGKSNFVEVFRFLRSIEEDINGLDDAISLHGGPGSILNVRLGLSEPLRIRVTLDEQVPWTGWEDILIRETTYDFGLRFGDPQDRVSIEHDRFTQILQENLGGKEIEARLDISMCDGRRRIEIDSQDVQDVIRHLRESPSHSSSFLRFCEFLQSMRPAMERRRPGTLLASARWFSAMGSWERLFGRVGVYDIDPHAVKRPHQMAGSASLQENGENLALVLRQILADPEKSREFHNLLRYILPFAVEIGTEQYLGESVLVKLREEYYEGNLLANLLSDGTVDVAALITALFFEYKNLVIIEEPERNIHPHLISGLMELMKDASRTKQIIVTTHSPEVVRHAGVENLLLISRDKEGFSTISRPAEKQDVKIFLENNLGLDEVFVQELWGP